MAYAAVTSLKGTLHLHFLQPQPRLPLQHNQEILNSLHENLGFFQEVLEKSEIAYNNSAMKDLEAEMRDVTFKAEERIEMELTTIYLAKGLTKSIRIKASLQRLRGIFIEAEKQTDYLKKEFIKISEKQLVNGPSQDEMMRRRGLLLGSTSSQPDPERENNITLSKFSKNASIKFDSRMVGCDKEFKTILDKLKQQSAEQLQVVSIVGMGGIGKTTLAGKVYKDPSITSYFYKQEWVTVSQEYTVVQMLRCLIGCVSASSDDEQSNNDLGQLADSLQKSLKGQRYLILIDDIWSKEAWDSLRRCFPDNNNNNGSRILLTSRLREVAEYAASSGNSIINMPFLDVNESWNLYCCVFGKTEKNSVFDQIGRDIVKKCKGLPLAITLVASLLSKTKKKVEKWKNVAERVIGDSNEACSSVLSLSYNQLPHPSKACFLYFGVFPEDYEIPVKKLVKLWAAEGFLGAVNNENLEEVATECLQDLVDRSLVLVGKQSYDGKIKTIRMHDLLRDLCIREARCENLLYVIGNDYHGAVARDVNLALNQWAGPLSPKNCRAKIQKDQSNKKLEKLSINRWYLKLQDSGIPWATSFLPNLKKLKLINTRLPWSDMRLIGMLPNLKVLKLIDACVGNEWETSEGGFRELKKLVIEGRSLKDWNAVGDDFPMLEHLELTSCLKLREIPIEFADISTLALIQLNRCSHSVLSSANCIQDEQRSYGNEALLVRSKNIRVSFYPCLHYISDSFTFHAI
ncbi:PREDICTED: putative disease resistance RPP13-like protein 3 [Ipomoea nil]|uniref:putative disease resistance RPP13-like protein 3 n=1 Tax=Ipomoea nil TaxID=35883 RepID=UPI000900CDDB|nr:PREDICTED: putative disease resistance RPP13-like protein 3 [Ipomoea nil]